MTDAELLAKATAFELLSVDPQDRSISIPRIRYISVTRRSYINDVPAWAVVGDGLCLNHDREWEYEPQPSSRTDEFFKRCRWTDLREAIAFVEALLAEHPSGYKDHPGNLAPPSDRGTASTRFMEDYYAMQAKKRPDNYLELSSQEQWEIDKKLGILDWSGSV